MRANRGALTKWVIKMLANRDSRVLLLAVAQWTALDQYDLNLICLSRQVGLLRLAMRYKRYPSLAMTGETGLTRRRKLMSGNYPSD